jgi:hypothetical protein
MTGLDVSELQAALNFHVRSPSRPLKPDGVFGNRTEARVREFQRLAMINYVGPVVVGPRTVAALYRTIGGVIDARPVLRTERALRGDRSPSALRRSFEPDRPSNPLLLLPQISRAKSQGFELESQFLFNPLARPSKGELPFQFTFSKSFPWPIFLPEPVELVVDVGVASLFELDAKIKVPFKIEIFKWLELKPYFFAGAGVNQDNFDNLNAGVSSVLTLKVHHNPVTGRRLDFFADGGVKYQHNFENNEGKGKGFIEGGVYIRF